MHGNSISVEVVRANVYAVTDMAPWMLECGQKPMTFPPSPYIEERNGTLYVAGTRVSVDSAVIAFQDGASPEGIVQAYSTLKLSQAYGVIAYYLENQQALDAYVANGEREMRESAAPLSLLNPGLHARLMATRLSKQS